MLSDDQIALIRKLYFEDQMKICEIESLTKFSYNTVKKYIEKKDFNLENPTTKPEKSPRPSILDPFKPTIDKYIQGDLLEGTHKQKHNGKRVYERLLEEEGYKGGYRTVNDYFQIRRKELGTPSKKAFIPLDHSPGEAQGDFGECENFIEDNNPIPGAHFSLSFPYSNASFIQLKYGQNTECLLESMKAIFEYIGGVPKEIWLDNASTMVASIGRTVDDRKMTPRLQAFSMHYGFKVKFANPHSGHDYPQSRVILNLMYKAHFPIFSSSQLKITFINAILYLPQQKN